MIIAMLGEAGAGKDTVADHLVSNFCFRKHTIAARLYAEIAKAYGLTIEFLSNRQYKDKYLDELSLVRCMDRQFVAFMMTLGFGIGEPLSPRVILHRWGDYRRRADPFYFLGPVLKDINAEAKANHVVSDVRTLLEYSELGKRHAAYWRVSRPGMKKVENHHTETALAKARVDVRLPNTGSICQLYDMVDALLFNEELMTA